MEEKNDREKYITDEEKHNLNKRLNIIEGQVRGIKQMVDTDRKCEDILIQVAAIDRALKSLGKTVLKSHINSCITNDIKNGNLDTLDDLFEMFGRIN